MAIFNFKALNVYSPKTFPIRGFKENDVNESHDMAVRSPKKYAVEDLMGKTKGTKKGQWYFTIESFHFFRPKGVSANYDITIVDHVTLHIFSRSLQEASKIIETEIHGGNSNILQIILDDINSLLQKPQLHEQHNLSWIPPLSQEEFVHHIPSGFPGEIHVESEDTGFVVYPSDIKFIKIFVDQMKEIIVKPEMMGAL
jgi:hypothetical protein